MSNATCISTITRNEAKALSLGIGVTGAVCLLLSVIGLVTELLFVCKKKNNFLLRLFVYLSISITITVGVDALQLLLYVDASATYYQTVCEILFPVLHYSITAEIFLTFSVNIVLLQKVFATTCVSCFRAKACTSHASKTKRFCFETLFLSANFGGSFIVVILSHSLVGKFTDSWPSWDVCFLVNVFESSCELLQKYVVYQMEVVIPASVGTVFSLFSIAVLFIWLVWLRKKQLLRAKLRTVSKEMTLFLT